MKVNKEKFEKAQKFIINQFNESVTKHGYTKKALQETVELIEEEFIETKDADYQISLMYLANEMNLTIRDFHKSQ